MKRILRWIIRKSGYFALAVTALPTVGFSATGGSFLWLRGSTGIWLFLLIVIGSIWLARSRPPWYLAAAARRVFWILRAGSVALCAGVIISVHMTSWPLRLTFAFSQSALNDLADRVERGEKIDTPVRCGLLVVQQAAMIEFHCPTRRVPCLYTKEWGTGSGGLARGLHDYQNWEYPPGTCGPIMVSHLTGDWVQTDED